MHMIPVGADLQELELIASLDPQTDVSQRLVDRRIEHGSSIFGWKHQVVEQNRNVMALVDVEAHPRDLRRKRRGMHPKGFMISRRGHTRGLPWPSGSGRSGSIR